MAHKRPARAQLLLGLQEVAAVGPEQRLRSGALAPAGHHHGAGGAVKAGDEGAAGVALWGVLALRE